MFKVNDEVIVVQFGEYRVARVQRVTKTQVTVLGVRYLLSSFKQCGGGYGHGRIMIVNEKSLAEMSRYQNERERRDLVYRVCNVNWRNLSTESLLAILAIVENNQ